MASRIPRNREEFSRISGVGAVKLEEFSEPFLALMRDYAESNVLAKTHAPVCTAVSKPAARRLTLTLSQTKELLEKKLLISDIAKTRGLAASTIVNQIELLIRAGEDLDLDYLMPPPARMAKIGAAFEQTQDIRLAPVRELLGEDYSYDELALTRISLRQSDPSATNGAIETA